MCDRKISNFWPLTPSVAALGCSLHLRAFVMTKGDWTLAVQVNLYFHFLSFFRFTPFVLPGGALSFPTHDYRIVLKRFSRSL